LTANRITTNTPSSTGANHGNSGIEDSRLNDRRWPDDKGDESCLRTNPKTDAIHSISRVSPEVESLECPKQRVRKLNGATQTKRVGKLPAL
jgi:hypothetical protein